MRAKNNSLLRFMMICSVSFVNVSHLFSRGEDDIFDNNCLRKLMQVGRMIENV